MSVVALQTPLDGKRMSNFRQHYQNVVQENLNQANKYHGTSRNHVFKGSLVRTKLYYYRNNSCRGSLQGTTLIGVHYRNHAYVSSLVGITFKGVYYQNPLIIGVLFQVCTYVFIFEGNHLIVILDIQFVLRGAGFEPGTLSGRWKVCLTTVI